MKDLNDIFLFSAVVRHKGFSAAARALQLPKSRLSKRVFQLEKQLGVRLLERSNRTMRVTDIGQAFFEKCEVVLASVEAAEAVIAEAVLEPSGIVRVSCPPALAQTLLASALPGFAARYPRVRVLVKVLNRPVDLVEERVDVALRARSSLQTDPNLMMRVLSRGPDILVASPGFIAEHGPITIADLSRLPCLSPHDEAERDTWQIVGSNKEIVQIRIEPRLACNDFDVILAAARAGLGVALLPDFVCEGALSSGELVRVLPDCAAPQTIIHAVYTARRGLPPAVRAFIDHLAGSELKSARG